jgi:hypothetical protein
LPKTNCPTTRTFFIAIFALVLAGCSSNNAATEQNDESPSQKIVSVAPNCENALRQFSLMESENNPGSVAWYVSDVEETLEKCRSYDWVSWVDANRSIYSTIDDYIYYSDTAPILANGRPKDFLDELCENYREANGTSPLACS